MKSTRQLIEENPYIAEYIRTVKKSEVGYGKIKLKKDEYFATMVTDQEYPSNKSPYVKGIEQDGNIPLVGLEKTSRIDNEGIYISKEYNQRNSYGRGFTVIIKIKQTDLDKFYSLDKYCEPVKNKKAAL